MKKFITLIPKKFIFIFFSFLLVFIIFSIVIKDYLELKNEIYVSEKLDEINTKIANNLIAETIKISSFFNYLLTGKNLLEINEILKKNNIDYIGIELRKADGTLIESLNKNGGKLERKNIPPWIFNKYIKVQTHQLLEYSPIYESEVFSFLGNGSTEKFITELLVPLQNSNVAILLRNEKFLLNQISENLTKEDFEFLFWFETEDNQIIGNKSISLENIQQYFVKSKLLGNYGMNINIFLAIKKNTLKIIDNLIYLLSFLFLIIITMISLLIFIAYRNNLNSKKLLQHQDLLIEQSKFVSLGEISTILAHEINQPLTSITLYASSLNVKLNSIPSDVSVAINNILLETDRISNIMQSVRAYIKSSRQKEEEVNVKKLIMNLENLIFLQAEKYNARVNFVYNASFRKILDRTLLEQVILNITRNAFEAMFDDSYAVKVLTINVDISSYEGIITFQDTGPGISSKVSSDIFKPFYSTKKSGLGFGLNLSKTLIERYGGILEWENCLPRGVKFMIKFPI